MRVIAATTFLLLAVTSGCDRQTNAASSSKTATTTPVGSYCTVQFRRDLLGVNRDSPIPPTTGSFNGAQVVVSGTLVDINAEWVILDKSASTGSTLWIPRQNVLLLSF